MAEAMGVDTAKFPYANRPSRNLPLFSANGAICRYKVHCSMESAARETRLIREEGGNRTNMQKNELMAAFTGYVYFPTNEQTADAALTRLWEALEQAGINADNIDFGKCELRDSDGNTQSVFRQP